MVFLGVIALLVLIMLFFMYMGCKHELGLFLHCGQCDFTFTDREMTSAERDEVARELEADHFGHKPITVQRWEIYR